jgi:hypothetical protein
MEGTIAELVIEALMVLGRAFMIVLYLALGFKIFRGEIRVGEKLVYLSAWILAPVLFYGFLSSDLFMINFACATVASIGFLEIVRS